MLDALVKAANEVRNDEVTVTLAFEGGGADGFKVPGHDSRLGQVISNLIDNARSFSPRRRHACSVTCRRLKDEVEIVVDDDGPGIRPDALEKIFERFYTDRPNQGFGQNSGLGLSISKQIIEAHGGRIWAENRTSPATRPARSRACSAPVLWCACRPNSRARRLAAPPRGSPRRLTLGRKPGYPRPPRPAEKINHSRPRIAAAENGPHRAPFGPSFSQCSRAPI